MMKVLTALVLGAAVLLILVSAATMSGAHRNAAARATPRLAGQHAAPGSGTVIAIRRSGPQTIMVARGQEGKLVRMMAAPGVHLVSADGHTLAANNVRLGDRLSTETHGQIVDRSQRRVKVRGLVAIGPASAGDTMVVSFAPSESVVIDLDKDTHYTDRSHETSSPTQIEDADVVQLQGVLDAQLGEMTQTQQIVRLGPFLHHKKGSGSKSA
jgi:hypothetical protein